MNMRIATCKDAQAVHEIMQACTEQLQSNGFNNWNHLTFEQTFQKVEKGGTYIGIVDDTIVGTVTVNQVRPTFYIDGDMDYWHCDDIDAGYIVSLAVLPEYQSRGYGAALMKGSEKVLRSQNCTYARLTAVTTNKQLCTFYHNIGYTKLQDRFVSERDTVLTFFEKRL